MMWGHARACVFGVIWLAGCLPDNPGSTATDSDTLRRATRRRAPRRPGPSADGLLACPAGEVCPLVFVAQTLDDRVEVFAPRHGPAYRGAIDLDLKPGTNPAASVGTLDEPFGMSLSGGFLHVITGHYPVRTSGSMVSFPVTFLAGYAPPATIPSADFFNAGQFTAPVVQANFAELEPIFLYEDDVQGRLLVGTFNNDLFDSDDAWTGVGKLLVADAADPATFASAELSGLMGGDCVGASELVLTAGTQAAVACDGNEAIAFVNLGNIGTGDVGAAAAAIGGTLCEIPGPRSNKRVRNIAPDGVGGVVITYGPTPLDLTADGVVYQMDPDCTVRGPVDVGTGGTAQLGEIVPYAPGFWLVASGSNVMSAQRGVFVVRGVGSDLELCGPVSGFDALWTTAGQPADPFGLAVTADGSGLAVGAAPFNGGDDQLFGKVLWAELTGTEDPCTMSATVTDLTDGVGDHAPASNPADPTTWRQGPNVVVIEEVAGG